MKTKILKYCLLLLLPFAGYSQNGEFEPAFWRFTSLDGELNVKGFYREKHTTINDFYEFQKSTYFSGGMKLNTQSYIYHPNFLILDIGGEYSPGTDLDDYLITPDRSEVRTLKALNLGAKLFSNKAVTLSSFYNLSENYSNRENLTNIKTNTVRWGSSLYIRTKFLPVNVRYNNLKWDQLEIENDRSFKTEQENFEVSTLKSFSKNDRNELTYSHNKYFRRDANSFEIQNTTDNFNLTNSLFFDKDKRYSFRSFIYDYNRKGDQAYHTFNATESLNFELPRNFRFRTTYNLYNHQQQAQLSNQNKINTSLSHQLFSSLSSRIYYDYSVINHSLYLETRTQTGFEFIYTKKIPTGNLNLAYNYSLLRNSMDNETVTIPIFNEAVRLIDGEITTLAKPYISMATIVVKDGTGTIIYQRDFDYILIEKGAYTEIQRVPGGQIENNSFVFVDYVAVQEGSYKYDAISNRFNAIITLFNRFLELYYQGHFMDYNNIEKSDLLILNYINQNIYGSKIKVGFVEIGAEYEDQNSTVTPYKMMRYFLNIQKRIKKFTFSVNGNIRDYDMVDENINRKYSDLSGSTAYQFNATTKIDFIMSYRQQRGPEIDLDLLRASSEFTTIIRQIYITAGVEFYRRNYLGDDTDFNSVYLQIARKF